MTMNPLTATDFYKADHRRQYPPKTTQVYSNLTPRSDKIYASSKLGKQNKLVFFGLQGFILEFLKNSWKQHFFDKPKAQVVAAYKRRLDNSLGHDSVPVEHIEYLHDLQYLPILIKALPEGSLVPMKVPMLTITNTDPQCFWLVNYLETILSASLWKPCTSATIAYEYRTIFEEYALLTCDDNSHVPFQGHDFSFRGMSGYQDGVVSGAGHLASFMGTDTIPSIDYLEEFYNANSDEEPIGFSVPATEHSVMAMGGQQDEIETFRRLITELYPTGIVSVVSDTWDYWKVLTEYAPALKDAILARKENPLGLAKVVFRPDSGDPHDIICGTMIEGGTTPEEKGSLELLWETFGGTYNSKGYKVLNPRVGLIYGDSITLLRARAILNTMEAKGFASSNVVFGIGSFTYQYNTRDTFGIAAKATAGVVDGEFREIFKDPKTDSGTKKSARGLLCVEEVDGEYVLRDRVSPEEEQTGALEIVFEDGELIHQTSLQKIRVKVDQNVARYLEKFPLS